MLVRVEGGRGTVTLTLTGYRMGSFSVFCCLLVSKMRNAFSRQNDGTLLSNFLDGHSTWNDYLAEMRKDGAWGDHLVLLAAANVFQRPIMVITSLLHNVEILIRPTHVSAGQVSDDLMLLGHVAGSHYVSLEPCLGKLNVACNVLTIWWQNPTISLWK